MDKKKENLDDSAVSEANDGKSVSEDMAKSKHIKWSPENELIMVEWCDIAQCYKWLNTRSHSKYSSMHAWFTIPAITLSTITGTASFAQSSLPEAYQKFSPMIIGAINIFIGILTTVQQYLKISELNEAHRVSAISWDKFARNIRIELSKEPSERTEAGQFIKFCRQEFDRLMETSPSPSPSVIREFNTLFKGKVGSEERKRFDALKKPDICNIIVTANEYRHHWYIKEQEREQRAQEMADVISMTSQSQHTKEIMMEQEQINQKRAEIEEKENMLKKKENEVEENREKKVKIHLNMKKSIMSFSNQIKSEFKVIDEYIEKFKTVNGRKPFLDEIKLHALELVNDKKIQKETMDKYLEKYDSEWMNLL
jgi:hypothetical protein